MTQGSKTLAMPLMALAAVLAQQALAQQATVKSDGLEEVIVTAERRVSTAQKTAASISVRTGDDLARSGRTTLQTMLEDVPGVSAGGQANDSQQGLAVTVRGLRNNVDTTTIPNSIAASAATAIYTDGVYEGIGNTYDIDRVEVLRGPQGTLYGRSATSGVVTFHTVDPKFDAVAGNASVEGGDHALRHISAGLNLPVSAKAGFRLSADRNQHDGYYTGEAGKVARTSARLKFRAQPNDALTIGLAYALEENEVHTGGRSGVFTPGTDKIDFSTAIPTYTTRNRFHQFSGQLDYGIGPMVFSYIGSYRHWQQGLGSDDKTYFSFNGENAYAVRRAPFDNSLSQEIHLSSREDSGVKWITGAVYYRNKISRRDEIHFAGGSYVVPPPPPPAPPPPPGPPLVVDRTGLTAVLSLIDKQIDDTAVFGEVTVPLGASTHFTGGARYDWSKVDLASCQALDIGVLQGIAPPGAVVFADIVGNYQGMCPGTLPTGGVTTPGRRDFGNFTYKARLEHEFTPSSLIYGMASSGFLPGDIQTGGGPAPVGSIYYNTPIAVPVSYPLNSTSLKALEIGSKNRFLGNKLQANLSVYYYDYGGFQQLIATIPGQVASLQLFGVPVSMNGLELETTYRATPNDLLSFNWSYVDASYGAKPALFAQNVVQDKVVGVVPHTFTAGFDHFFNAGGVEMNVHGDVRNISSVWLGGASQDLMNAGAATYLHRSGQFLANASLTAAFNARRYTLTGYIRNIANNRFATGAMLNTVGMGPATSITTVTGSASDPRTIGVIFGAKF